MKQSCWVCGSTKIQTWKIQNVQDHLESSDLLITDARYGLTVPLLRCEVCDFCFAKNPDEMTALYVDLDDPGYEEGRESRALQMRWLISLVRAFHPHVQTVLDVGAASGLLVSEATQQGLDAIGIEPSRHLVKIAQQRGIPVLQGVLPDPILNESRFDAIFLVDVIEHVNDPVDLLIQCRNHLASDGVLLIVTPDAGSIAARVFGSRWWHYRLAHIGYFKRYSLTVALKAAGLKPQQWKRAKWFFPIGYLATRSERYFPLERFNRFAHRIGILRWLYQRVIPLNLFDSFAVLVKHAKS